LGLHLAQADGVIPVLRPTLAVGRVCWPIPSHQRPAGMRALWQRRMGPAPGDATINLKRRWVCQRFIPDTTVGTVADPTRQHSLAFLWDRPGLRSGQVVRLGGRSPHSRLPIRWRAATVWTKGCRCTRPDAREVRRRTNTRTTCPCPRGARAEGNWPDSTRA